MKGEIALATAIENFSLRIIDLQRQVFALSAALANQPALARSRLAQDFRVAYKHAGGDPDAPSKELQAVLTVLSAPHESSPQLSLGEKLMRLSALQPPPPPPPEAPTS